MLKDNIDRKILNILQRNARLSYAEIGRLVNLSSPAIAERVQRLEDVGIIKGYAVEIDRSKLDHPLEIIVQVKLDNARTKALTNILKDRDEIIDFYSTTEEYCFLIRLALKDHSKVEEIINLISRYGNTNSSIIISKVFENKKIEFKTEDEDNKIIPLKKTVN